MIRRHRPWTSPVPRCTGAIGVLLLTSITLIGCVTTPAPTPSATPAFANEKEAFAAAEKTYRAYNDAGNADADEAANFLTGAALKKQLESERYLEQRGLSVSGPSQFDDFVGISVDDKSTIATVIAELCLDVSESRLIDPNGIDITPIDRVASWRLSITFVGTNKELKISDSKPLEGKEC